MFHFFLTRCVLFPSGEYLALTGEKLNGVEMIACGLATHYCLNAVCSFYSFFFYIIILSFSSSSSFLSLFG